jgi:hypothetical protein
VKAPLINQSTGLLSLKAIPDLKSVLGPVRTSETAGDSEDAALDDYNSDIIIVNTSRSKSEGGGTQELTEYTRTTQDS